MKNFDNKFENEIETKTTCVKQILNLFIVSNEWREKAINSGSVDRTSNLVDPSFVTSHKWSQSSYVVNPDNF